MASDAANVWRVCSACKKPILQGAKYYVCSVSTCNGQRTGYVFCTFLCFERHLPEARHRDAGAVEKTAPFEVYKADAPKEGVRRIVTGASGAQGGTHSAGATMSATTPLVKEAGRPMAQGSTGGTVSNNNEVLVIASRLKDYISAKSDFNTSGDVMQVLSNHLRVVCDRAIDNARADGRKTVMERDFSFLKNR
jgi:hypothetical protein